MHGDSGAPRLQRQLEFLDEESFPADLRERNAEPSVTLGGHAEQQDIEVRIALQQTVSHVLRLPHGQRTFAGGDSQTVANRHYGPCAMRQTQAYHARPSLLRVE